ncbi:RNA polymerase sigma factor [Teredinibacter sp. KSP-S5-2]|uniref:RNA polymerase sigma factor n=1 Tax=Teredinibacter sp. KSP-S5-2 TaxID=3034506 RepID=UPI002934E724|nr:RNA polymerase sigma factor [Teredinibacter sp. KSP-S5-2]WNO07622.1 RNA polymerase sigma factor [Teredinibacter sp. KSP-S5-2]
MLGIQRIMADEHCENDEKTLVSLYKAKDEKSIQARNNFIQELYHTHRASLQSYIAGLLPNGYQDSGEVLNETYIRLLRMDSPERLDSNPKAYIYTIATNIIRDEIRRKVSRKHDAHVEFNEEECSPDESLNPVNNVSFSQSMNRMKEVLFQLPKLTRDIFLLSRFEEMTYPEIAESLGVSTRTVERHMSKACGALQASVGGSHE